MKIARTVLASMDSPYAVTLHREGDRVVADAASEQQDGMSFRFEEPDWSSCLIAERPGGCMGVVSLCDAGMQGVLMIEDFIPIFKSERSGAAIYRPTGKNGEIWERLRVFDLPFLHRVALVRPHGHPVLVAGQLCRGKKSQDDWSNPGGVYLIQPNREGKAWKIEPQPILDGLHRNHGLFTQRVDVEEQVYVAADEGVFLLRQPSPHVEWIVERIHSEPTSDMYMFDMDGDGQQEMASIHPFHGDTARIYKQIDGRWQPVWEEHGTFGHVVWAGRLREHICLMLGWRDGEKNLDLYTLEDPRAWRFRKMTIDANVAPLNISVLHDRDRDLILASHGVSNQVVLYTVS